MQKIILMILIFSCSLSAQYFTKDTTNPCVKDGGDSRSVNWVDYDNDGDLDLFVTNGPASGANCFLYKNNGDRTFEKITDAAIVNDQGSYDGSTWADYDNDGYIDAFSVTWYGQNNRLYRQPDGIFEKISSGNIATDKTYSETASWADYDNDGYVDLYVANSEGNLQNILYHNNGDGTFSRVTTGAMVTDAKISRSVDWCDFDNDGFVDLFVANESNNNNSLYWNNGDGTFTAEVNGAIVSDGGNSFGSSVGDINNDGYFDIFVANHANQNNFLYLNNGDRTFTETDGIVVSDGGYSIGSTFGDFNNDGNLDLFVTNGFSGGTRVKNFLYLNRGGGSFTKIDTGVVSTDDGWSYGTACGDYDGDGAVDIFTANCYGANQNNSLYHNEGNGNSWITIQLIGTKSNFSAIGARVRAKALVNGNSIWQVRHVSGQSGYCGQNLEIHFGFKDAAVIDSLIVEWPSGQKTIQTDVNVRQHLKITESASTEVSHGSYHPDQYLLHQNYPNPFNPTTTIQFSIAELSIVNVKIFDLLGREVATLVNDVKETGSYTASFNAKNLSSGMYIVRLTVGTAEGKSFVQTRKMMMIK